MGGTSSKPAPTRIAVLGGGPAGLAAAHRLLSTSSASAPTHVDVYEATDRFGGSIVSETDGGFLYDLGPNSMNAKHAPVYSLIHQDLNLSSLIERRQSSRRILIFKNGSLLPVPLSPLSLLRSPLLSVRAKLRLLREPFVKKLPDRQSSKESVANFIARRFGQETLDYIIDPALAGVYSAAPANLSMKHAFTRIWALERARGSVLMGLLRPLKQSNSSSKTSSSSSSLSSSTSSTHSVTTSSSTPTPTYSRTQLMESFSFVGGMATLPTALVSAIRSFQTSSASARLLRNARVRTLERETDGTWRVNGRGRYDAVISTMPTHALRNIDSNVNAIRRAFSKLAERVQYAPVAVVVLGFDRDDVPKDIYGFGTLFPSKEGRKLLGVNFTSHGFPGRMQNPDKVFWTVYVGGMKHPEMAFKSAKEVVDVSTTELQQVFGVKSKPTFARVKKWPLGIPIYHPGYDEAICTMARVEKRAPGLVLGGNYRGGVGVPDALLSGLVSADRARLYLKKKHAGESGKARKKKSRESISSGRMMVKSGQGAEEKGVIVTGAN